MMLFYFLEFEIYPLSKKPFLNEYLLKNFVKY